MLKIVDSHHKVLTYWADYRKSLKEAPQLITFDHHTDTSPPFRKIINELSPNKEDFLQLQKEHLDKVDFKQTQSIITAIENLNNDEHIITAIKTDIIHSAFVLAHNAQTTDLDTYKEHRVVCHSVEEVDHEKFGKIPNHNTVLESHTINKALLHFNQILGENSEEPLLSKNFILDIDLDYFNTFDSLEPKSVEKFIELTEKAGLITIATEPDYVKTCAIDNGLSSDYLLKKVIALIPSHLT